MAYVPVPTRTSTTSSMYADVNQLQDNIDVIYDALNPIGSQYVQHASVASNTISIACPSSEAPAALFGGTWTKLWATEATYFRTEGDPDVSEGQDANRTTGSEPDRFQGHWHSGNGAFASASSGPLWVYSNGTGSYVPVYLENIAIYSPISDGPHGTPRTGYTTQVKNRIMIIWKRTA